MFCGNIPGESSILLLSKWTVSVESRFSSGRIWDVAMCLLDKVQDQALLWSHTMGDRVLITIGRSGIEGSGVRISREI